jgi:hypothetical protein
VLYWLACFVLTGLAMVMALLDLRAMRRRAHRQQRELIERTLREVQIEKERRAARDREEQARKRAW